MTPKEYALNVVKASQGITGTQLVLRLCSMFMNIDAAKLRSIPAELSMEGEIVEIEYIIPNKASQSFFLPKGTEIKR